MAKKLQIATLLIISIILPSQADARSVKAVDLSNGDGSFEVKDKYVQIFNRCIAEAEEAYNENNPKQSYIIA